MLTQEHLALRLVRLKAAEKWVNKSIGLVFVFPKGGTGICRSPGAAARRIGSGDVIVLTGPVEENLHADENSEIVFWYFALRIEQLFPLFASHEISLLQNVIEGLKEVRHHEAATPLAQEIHRLLTETPPRFDLDHRGQLIRIAAAILAAEFKTAHGYRAGFARPGEHVIEIFDHLSASELLSLSVTELAGRFSCSKRHLNRLFHQHFGFSVAALRMEMRLLKAISLLRDPSAKVIHVAEQCGFNHLGLFNTCFKRRFGVSPGHWRSREAEPPPDPSRTIAMCPLRSNGLCPWTGNPDGAHPTPQPPVTQRTASARLLVTVKGLSTGCAADGTNAAGAAGQSVVSVRALADRQRDPTEPLRKSSGTW